MTEVSRIGADVSVCQVPFQSIPDLELHLPLPPLFTEAGTALEQGYLTPRVEKIVGINNYLNDTMCTIPFFYIDP